LKCGFTTCIKAYEHVLTTLFFLQIVKCPPDSEYIECGPACIPSCKEPSTNCTGSCISGCFCKPGFSSKSECCVKLRMIIAL
uniref:TIL domain-containing protein n=1 Tax=Electrophorus electricus TaxID=8005 RepID=A0AAY5F6M5_ELEEL